MEHPKIQFQLVDDQDRILYTVWTRVSRQCRDCQATFETTIDEQHHCTACVAKMLAEAIFPKRDR